GIRTFILPAKNQRDLHEVDREILDAMTVIAVETVAQVLDHALLEAEMRQRRERRGAGFLLPISPPSNPINA
ncbi:MAG: hypothetical protein JOZ92_08405, partial [Candidatus Dormibacteraeota bacterium]|nr:hypothetical protein [Candidatus Dormibacteraeota bacterium]